MNDDFLTFLTIACTLSCGLAGAETLTDWKLQRTLPLAGETHHVQGIAERGGTLWVTSVDAARRTGYLFEYSSRTGARKRAVEIQDGIRFHPGGLSLHGDSLWIPVAEYKRNSTAVIQRRNARTLQLEFQFPAPDHIGCLAVTPEFLVGGNWDSREFYIWNHSGKLIRKVANSTANAYQDIKFHAGHLVASGLLIPGRDGAIDWLEFPALTLSRRIAAGKTDRGVTFTQEGMAIAGRQLLLLPEDGPSRLFVFEKK